MTTDILELVSIYLAVLRDWGVRIDEHSRMLYRGEVLKSSFEDTPSCPIESQILRKALLGVMLLLIDRGRSEAELRALAEANGFEL